jgi:hypothetical protein
MGFMDGVKKVELAFATGEASTLVSTTRCPELTGSELPVKVDPPDPQKVVVDWDAAAAEARPQ